MLRLLLLLLLTATPAAADTWIGSWGAAPQPAMPAGLEKFQNETVRLIVHVSAGGPKLRVRFSNLEGGTPLKIGAAHVARRIAEAEIDPATDRALSFGGQATATIPPHGALTSDPVDLDLPALSDLAVSLFLPGPTTAQTTHILAQQTSYVAAGDSTGAAKFPVTRTLDSWPFLTRIDVPAGQGAGTIVAFGDSLVDGDGSTSDANKRWPDQLAARLQAAGRPLGVLNEGLIGNQLLRDSPAQARKQIGASFGESGLRRFQRDVLDQPGLHAVVLRIGGNDLGLPGAVAAKGEAVTAAQLIAGYRKLATEAQRHGLRVIGTTLSPFEDTTIAPGYYTPAKDAIRREVNDWLRAHKPFDALIDTDMILRDPDHPARLAPKYDSGDHLHPNDAGYAAIADAFPLALFE
jgi:lysophospholipase L1-like esterase